MFCCACQGMGVPCVFLDFSIFLILMIIIGELYSSQKARLREICMIIHIDKTGTIKELEKIIDNAILIDGAKSLAILSCDNNNFVPENIDDILTKIMVPVTGGIFPALIYKNEKIDKGSIIIGTQKKLKFITIPFLSDDDVNYDILLNEKISDQDTFKTVFVFVDGYSKRISTFIDSLYNIIGCDTNYFGAGAGSLNFKQTPCLFTNKGLVSDSAIICGLDINSSIGVSHGWKPISEPYNITESEGNILRSLDWKPAFEVYQNFVQQYSGKSIQKDNFSDMAKAFPFGISRINAEWLVRDPIAVLDDNSIVCVGEIAKGAHVYILTADNASLIKAAKKALCHSKERLNNNAGKQIRIIIDCISRVIFLGKNFKQEIDTVYEENIPVIGVCALGEIANAGNRYLEFYNKTIVVGALVL